MVVQQYPQNRQNYQYDRQYPQQRYQQNSPNVLPQVQQKALRKPSPRILFAVLIIFFLIVVVIAVSYLNWPTGGADEIDEPASDDLASVDNQSSEIIVFNQEYPKTMLMAEFIFSEDVKNSTITQLIEEENLSYDGAEAWYETEAIMKFNESLTREAEEKYIKETNPAAVAYTSKILDYAHLANEDDAITLATLDIIDSKTKLSDPEVIFPMKIIEKMNDTLSFSIRGPKRIVNAEGPITIQDNETLELLLDPEKAGFFDNQIKYSFTVYGPDGTVRPLLSVLDQNISFDQNQSPYFTFKFPYFAEKGQYLLEYDLRDPTETLRSIERLPVYLERHPQIIAGSIGSGELETLLSLDAESSLVSDGNISYVGFEINGISEYGPNCYNRDFSVQILMDPFEGKYPSQTIADIKDCTNGSSGIIKSVGHVKFNLDEGKHIIRLVLTDRITGLSDTLDREFIVGETKISEIVAGDIPAWLKKGDKQ